MNYFDYLSITKKDDTTGKTPLNYTNSELEDLRNAIGFGIDFMRAVAFISNTEGRDNFDE